MYNITSRIKDVAGATDEIFKSWEMVALTDNLSWNDKIKSYKCNCQRMYFIFLYIFWVKHLIPENFS